MNVIDFHGVRTYDRHAEGRGFESRRGGHIRSRRVPSKRQHSVPCRIFSASVLMDGGGVAGFVFYNLESQKLLNGGESRCILESR